MEKPLDLRIQKTYQSLIGAFLQLLKEKPFETITVHEICDMAMVRRATFYKHFGDKYEFFTFLVRYLRDEFRKDFSKTDSSKGVVAPYVDIIRFLMDFLDENEALVQSVMESTACPILMDLVSEQIVRDVKEMLCEDEKRGMELMLSPKLMAQAYTGALVNITSEFAVEVSCEIKRALVTARTGVFSLCAIVGKRNNFSCILTAF